ncbi:uncharacterized protein TRAVEDRAFT_48759 [Trametes versicolor FP-101664 SS1]|uniref:uncharacterized protein n=1 Tax=Trametes versicolor (strain FP-101664) TaxID=717944 RepID=UPI0004621C70|nr:uncharacterized protein TRAVEDRAFT_48759 [Trametes versicolor FP-101664 SS1]EIW57724.1 hypothetical protein TRAVEDRAFT_48759 [Trametes versicolor FP-101664 SS1]
MSAASVGLPGLPASGDPPSLDNTYGATLLGTFFGLILYGLAIHQVYRYSRMGFNDSWFIKGYVAFIMLVDTLHVILSMHTCYYYLVGHYFQPAVLFTRVWSIDNLGLIAAVTIVSCQCFYARRVWLIGPKYRFLVVIAVVIFLGELACSTYAAAQASLLPSYGEFRELTWLYSVAFALVVVSDIILTTVLIFVLHRSRTGIAKTDSMLDVLIAYIISTGLLTEIFSILSLIFPLVYLNSTSMVYIALDIVVTKMYVNSVIGTLNFRRTLASYGTGSVALEIGLSNLPSAGPIESDPRFAPSSYVSQGGSISNIVEYKVARQLGRDRAITIDMPRYGSSMNV